MNWIKCFKKSPISPETDDLDAKTEPKEPEPEPIRPFVEKIGNLLLAMKFSISQTDSNVIYLDTEHNVFLVRQISRYISPCIYYRCLVYVRSKVDKEDVDNIYLNDNEDKWLVEHMEKAVNSWKKREKLRIQQEFEAAVEKL